jgi:hypothetical protein
MAHRRGTASGGKVRVVLRGQGATVGRIIEPLSGKTASERLILEGGLTGSEGIVLRLYRNSRGGSKVVLWSISCGAFIIVRVVKTLLRRKRQR